VGSRISLATGTEVGVVADCTLISVSNNVGLGAPGRIAERSIAVDSHVARSVGVPHLTSEAHRVTNLCMGMNEAGVTTHVEQ